MYNDVKQLETSGATTTITSHNQKEIETGEKSVNPK
jgi:hypothetical protein